MKRSTFSLIIGLTLVIISLSGCGKKNDTQIGDKHYMYLLKQLETLEGPPYPSGVPSQKRYYIFSAPVAYNGEFYDSMEKIISNFMEQMKKQLPNPEYQDEFNSLYALSYYLGPGLDNFTSKEECQAAIEASKLEVPIGWLNSDRYKIVQLK